MIMIKYFEELIPALSEFLHKILGNFHDFTVTVADIAIIFVISNFIFALIRKVTKRYFERKVKQTKNTSRYVTLSKLFDHIIVVTMWFIIIVAALSEPGSTEGMRPRDEALALLTQFERRKDG